MILNDAVKVSKIIQELKLLKSITKIEEKYGVTDNSIRKWLKTYNMPHKAKELKNFRFDS